MRFDLLHTELPPSFIPTFAVLLWFLSLYLIFLEDEYLQSSVYHKCKDNVVRDSASDSELHSASPCNLSDVGLTHQVFCPVSPWLSCPRYCRIVCSAWKPSLLTSSSALPLATVRLGLQEESERFITELDFTHFENPNCTYSVLLNPFYSLPSFSVSFTCLQYEEKCFPL